MPVVTTHTPGTFSWVELSSPDTGASKSFYSQLLGLEWDDMNMGEGMHYTMMKKDGEYVCGLFHIHQEMIDQGIPPHWACYIFSDDVDAITQKVADNGGTVISGPFDVFEAGRMSLFADPTGAAFCVWQAKEHIGSGRIHEPGALGWTELYTYDTEAASAFYSNVFGWSRTTHQVGPEQEDYHVFMMGEINVAGMIQIKPDWGEVPPNWGTYFCVADVDASFQQAQDLGGEVVVPLMAESDIRFCFLKDPQGVYFGLVQVMGE